MYEVTVSPVDAVGLLRVVAAPPVAHTWRRGGGGHCEEGGGGHTGRQMQRGNRHHTCGSHRTNYQTSQTLLDLLSGFFQRAQCHNYINYIISLLGGGGIGRLPALAHSCRWRKSRAQTDVHPLPHNNTLLWLLLLELETLGVYLHVIHDLFFPLIFLVMCLI